MYLPRVGYYRCHPVPITSRVDDKITLCIAQQVAQDSLGKDKEESEKSPVQPAAQH